MLARKSLIAAITVGFIVLYLIIISALPPQYPTGYSSPELNTQFHQLVTKGHIKQPRHTIGLLSKITTVETTKSNQQSVKPAQLSDQEVKYDHLGCFIDTIFGPKTNQWRANGFDVQSQRECVNQCFRMNTAFCLYKRNTKLCLCEHWYNSQWKHEGECSKLIKGDSHNHDVMYFGNITGLVITSQPEWSCSCINDDCVRIKCKNVKCWIGPTPDDLSELQIEQTSCPANHYTVLTFKNTSSKKFRYCIHDGSLRGFWPKKKCNTRGRLYDSHRLYEIKSQDGIVEVEMKPDKNQTKILLLGFFRSSSTLMSEMFAANQNVLYLFEPLIFMVGDMDAVTVKNQSHSQTAKNLEALYDCDMFRYPYKTFNYFNQTPAISKECDHSTFDSYFECLANYWTRCVFKPIITSKIIRASTVPIKKILKSGKTKLKVVVLLRDPRAIIRSWNTEADNGDRGGDNAYKAVDLCERQKEFSSMVSEFSKQYPNQVTIMHSEDLIMHLNESINHVYHTLGLRDPPNSVLSGLYNITHGIQSGGYMSELKMDEFKTFRNDSFISAFKWKTEFNFSYVQKLDEMCSDSYQYTGYRPVQSAHQLTNMTMLHRISPYDTV